MGHQGSTSRATSAARSRKQAERARGADHESETTGEHGNLWAAITEIKSDVAEIVGFIRAIKWAMDWALKVIAITVSIIVVTVAVVMPLVLA